METVELKIEYTDALTPEQVLVFYSGLNDLLTLYNIADAKFVISEGSLLTKIITTAKIIGLAVSLTTSFLNPKHQTEVKTAFNITNSFNNNNFINFTINKTTIYNKDNIAGKNAEFKKLAEQYDRQKITQDVETLEIQISRTKITKTEICEIKNKKSNRKNNCKYQFAGIINRDKRYANVKDEIKIVIKDIEQFKNIDFEKDDYYFIADGKLTRDDDKYTKFEVAVPLVKSPSKIHKEEEQRLL